MRITVYGEQSDPALVQHLRGLMNLGLGEYSNFIDQASLYWKSEEDDDGRPTRYGCCVHLGFFNHQTAEATYWDPDLSEAARRSAELAAKLASRCCHKGAERPGPGRKGGIKAAAGGAAPSSGGSRKGGLGAPGSR
jgi:hypothetical protein